MRILAVIPARYSSTRLPGKPLVDICGRPMICRVYDQVRRAELIDDVVVATDDERIRDAVQAVGGRALMTSRDCASGSDRLLEVAQEIPADIYINVQGDEPLLDPKALDLLADAMQREDRPPVATLAHRVSAEAAQDPNLVKVVCDTQGNALYFSRSPVPFVRDAGTACAYLAHIGVYAYTEAALHAFGGLAPSPLEEIEKLEQLRFLQAGIDIRVYETEAFGPGVDTPKDLEIVRRIISGEKTVSREESLQTRLSRIRLIITDVDGVLTDGSLYYGSDGECLKCFNARDGLGVVLAKKHGLQIAVLSGRDCPALRRRLSDLGITIMRLGRLEKASALAEIMKEADCRKEECLFLGDDITDIAGFEGCSIGVAVQDAHPKAKEKADIILDTCGGHGALREIIDLCFGSHIFCI